MQPWLYQTSSIKDNGGYMLQWTFNAAEMFFWTLPQICAWHNPVSELYMLGFSSDISFQLLDL